MPLSEYGSSIGGGLKLKGVKDGRVKKQKKKSSSKDVVGKSDDLTTPDTTVQEPELEEKATELVQKQDNRYGKTEAQLRHEERRRKLMEERAEKDGVKSHKQRVDELNKYLSKLSEHNDMPKIGPG